MDNIKYLRLHSDNEIDEMYEHFEEKDRLNDIARAAFEIEQAELAAEAEQKLYGAPARDRYS